jgi:hypothetical protein
MVMKPPNPSGWLSENPIWLPVCIAVMGFVPTSDGHDADAPVDDVNVSAPVTFPELSSERFAVKVVLPVYRVDCVEPVQDALAKEGINSADTIPVSPFTPHPDVLLV